MKNLGALRPVDETGEAVFRHIAQGEVVTVELKRERNIMHHRRLFAMLQLVLENQEHYKSVEDLLEVMKLRIGHCRTISTKYGEVRLPQSISFAALDQDGFNDFYARACAWVIAEVIPGLKRKDLDAEVEAKLLAFGAPEG